VTKRLPFTELSLRRAISAAQKAGLTVMAIKPDGTIITARNVDKTDQGLDVETDADRRWGDGGDG
jgi:hypothetical protein